MKTYKVIARSISYLDKEIEAENEEQAWQIANALDGDEFKYSFAMDWDIYSVEQVTKGESK
jgi:hypothetical protein